MREPAKVFSLIRGLGVGGAEKLLALSLPHIDRERFAYEVGYLIPRKSALVPEFQRAQIPVFCLNHPQTFDLRAIVHLAKVLREHRVDLLHVHLPYAAVVGRIAARMAGVKAIVYTEHNVLQRQNPVSRTLNRLTFSLNDAVIAVSEEVHRSLLPMHRGNSHPKVVTIHNGIDPEVIAIDRADARSVRQGLGIPPNDFLVANVANFAPKKRHEDLLQAAKVVGQRAPNVTFLLIGHGPIEDRVKRQAAALGLTGKVIFTGFRPDATRLVAASDVFVLSSLYEGLPIALLEAMALGLPVVATRVGGVPEVVNDGVEGLLAEPKNPTQLAEKILALLGNTELCQKMGNKARERVRKHFDIRVMVRKTETLYTEVLSNASSLSDS